jgi:hypothetical protein
MNAGGAQVLEHHNAEIGFGHIAGVGLQRAFAGIEDRAEAVVASGGHAVRDEALDGEGAGDTNDVLVFVGTVVEQLDIRGLGDGLVGLLLPGDARFRPVGVEGANFRADPPGMALAVLAVEPGVEIARNLPLLPIVWTT